MRAAVLLSILIVLAVACAGARNQSPAPVLTEVPLASAGLQRDADVPELPFPDNPDPGACGIPTPWHGHDAQIDGTYQGQLVEPTVYLYDSHQRLHVTGAVLSGTPVQVELYQSNPVLDFFYIRVDTPAGTQTGWVPAPFLRFSDASP